MMRSFVRVVVAGALVIGATACGGGDDKVSAGDFASDVCSAVGDWMREIQGSGQGIESEIDGAGSDLGKIKDAIVGFLDDGVDATETVITEVDDAGVPEGDDGEEIADRIQEGFEEVKKAFEEERDAVEGTESDDPQELVSQFEDTQSRLGGEALEKAFGPLEEFEDSDVSKEFETNDTCQSIGE
jgi:hypothetical protein